MFNRELTHVTVVSWIIKTLKHPQVIIQTTRGFCWKWKQWAQSESENDKSETDATNVCYVKKKGKRTFFLAEGTTNFLNLYSRWMRRFITTIVGNYYVWYLLHYNLQSDFSMQNIGHHKILTNDQNMSKPAHCPNKPFS